MFEAGLSADFPNDTGFTLLDTAVLANRVDVARVLVSHGANVNALDKAGMTPLLYAASIDYGDSAMIDLLLKAGASKHAKTAEGQTALDLARKYDHVSLVKSLQ